MDPISLLIIIVVIFLVWLIIRKVWQTITCTVRMLFYIIIAVVILYIVGSSMGWPIVNLIDGIVGDVLGRE